MNEITIKLFTLESVLVLIGFIILFFLIGIIIKRRQRLNRSVRASRIMRYLLLLTLLIYLVCIQLLELPRTYFSIKITETILIIFAISFILNMINHFFFSDDNIITKKETIPKLGRDIIHFILAIIASAFVFSYIWKFDLGSLLAALGVGSFVIGLVLQEPLGNLFNGVSLLMAKPFQKGDWVQIGEELGKVVEFNWRSVKLVNRFNELIIIPNNMLGRERIKNLSRPGKIHAELITIEFSYNDNPYKVKQVLLDISKNTEGVLASPESIPLTISYDDFYITYGLKFFIKDFEDQILLKDRLMTQILDVAAANQLTIPYPIIQVQKINTKNDTNF